jgi:hypothetical protein
MAGDELVRSVAVALLPPMLGQHEFLLRIQHRKPPDFFRIGGKAGFARQIGQCSSVLDRDSTLDIHSASKSEVDESRKDKDMSAG